MNGINGDYLRNITENATSETSTVWAAVAYATESSLLFDWCFEHNIPLKFYGRLDETVPVNPIILERFLKKKSNHFICKLVQHHHAKVIWWKGVGIYIGSANLTPSAWYKNIEAGCYFPENEITSQMIIQIEEMFDKLETQATPLTQELLQVMKSRNNKMTQQRLDANEFWNSPSLNKWNGLDYVDDKKARTKNKEIFLREWHATLQELRNIADLVSKPENQPVWIDPNSPSGAQADQFLHAHYYNNTFQDRKANYEYHYNENKHNSDSALKRAIDWWKQETSAPSGEDKTLNEHAPYLKEKLSQDKITNMDIDGFYEICSRVYAISDYARRVSNIKVNLLNDGTRYSNDQKIKALSQTIWNDQQSDGKRIKDLLLYVLYEGTSEQLPERLWNAIDDPIKKIEGLGISSLGEIVGWAFPDTFPPRNGRTSKALRSLGYNVKLHVH
jgi:hypothetical protein